MKDLDLRDYFAGQALGGAFSQLAQYEIIKFDAIVKDCYTAADAMLKEKNKT